MAQETGIRFGNRLCVVVTIYRGAKCLRHWKQGENSRKRCRVGHRKTADKKPEEQPKHPKENCFGCFGCFPAVFWLLFGCFTGTVPSLGIIFGCFSAVFIFGHLAPFGTSVDGRSLVTQHCDPPPIALQGIAIPIASTFLGIAVYRAMPPLLGVSQNYVEGG